MRPKNSANRQNRYHFALPVSGKSLIPIALMVVFSPVTLGQTTVTNLDDSGPGSLRDALANASSGDVIEFATGLTGTINLSSQLEINQSVTITGTGVTIDGGASTRLFFVNPGAGEDVTLSGLTLTNGNAQGGDGGDGGEGGGGGGLGAGGAVFAQSGDINLVDVDLTNNAAVGGNGGVPGTFSGGGGGGGGLGGNGGNGLSDDVSGGGGGGGLTQNGANGQSNGTGGAGGGAEGGAGANASSSSTAGDGQFGGGGGGGGGGFDGPGFRLSNSNFPGADGGFGGGGGGGASDDFEGADGGDGGFGAGGGGGAFGDGPESFETDGTTQGGAGGLGGGAGGSGGSTTNAGAPGSGGGGAGLGGAVFIASDATLVLTSTQTVSQSSNTVTAGVGGASGSFSFTPTPGEAGENGQIAGDFLFFQGDNHDLTFDVEQGVIQSLNLSSVADETALTDGNGAAGTGVANLFKTGHGELSLSGSSNFSGAITINQGSISAVSGGIGSLTLNNDLTINSDGQLNVEFNASSIDQIDVNGTANLSGTVNFIELAPGAAVDTPLTFLMADAINGSFDNVTTVFLNGTSLSSADVSYTATEAAVTFSEFTAQFSTLGLTGSGSSAGSVIDQLALSNPGSVVDIINAINSSPNVGLALESQSNVIGNASASAVLASQTQITNIARTRVNGLGSSISAGAFGLASSGFPASSPLIAEEHPIQLVSHVTALPHELRTPRRVSRSRPLQRIGWIQAVGGFNRISGDSQSLGIDSTSVGTAVGYEISNNNHHDLALLGVFFGYTDTDARVDGIADSTDASNFQIGVYGQRQLSRHWATNGTVSFSYLDFETSRPTVLGVAEGDFDGFAFQGTAELLYHIQRRERLFISPLVGLEFSVVHRNAYTETGAGALNLSVQDETNEFLNSLVGIQTSSHFSLRRRNGRGLDVYSASRFAWAYQYLDDSASITSSLTAPGSIFTSEGPRRNRGSFRGGFNLEVVPARHRNVSLFSQYTVDVTSDASDQIVQGGFRLRF